METTKEPLVSLVKGEKVDLTKTNPGLTKVNVGMGWDIAGANSASYDLDAYAFGIKNGKLEEGKNSILFFGNKTIKGAKHGGDNLTGAGDGDDETIMVDLAALTCDEVILGVNIYEADKKKQTFGQVKNAFIRVYNPDNNTELCKFDLSEDYSKFTSVTAGRLYRKDNEWKFEAIGNGGNGDINQLASPYA